MSFETVVLFPGSSLIEFKTSFLETVSKQNFRYQSLLLTFYNFLHFQNLCSQLVHAEISLW